MEIWAKRGKFYSHFRTETLVCLRGISAPNDQPTIHRVAQSLECGTVGVEKLIVGDLNACLVQHRYHW